MPVAFQRSRLGLARPARVGLDRGDPINEQMQFCLLANGASFYDLGPLRLRYDASLQPWTQFSRVVTRFGVASTVDATRIAPSPLDFSQLKPTGPYSVMIRCGFPSGASLGESAFFSYTNGSSWTNGITLYANGTTTINGRLFARMRYIHSYGQALLSDYLIPADGTGVVTIIGTYDGDKRRLYIDGLLAGEETSTAPVWTGIIGADSWAVGNNRGGFSAITTWEQARLWSRALTPAEIMRLSREEPHAGLRSGVSFTVRTAGGSFDVSLSDAATPADAISALLTAQAALSDAATPGDTTNRTSTFLRTLTDALAAGEAITSTATFQRAISDSVAAGDTIAAGAAYVVLISDSAAAGDAVTSGVALVSTISDGVAAGDAASSSSAFVAAISDSVSATDAAAAASAFLATIAESITASDAASATAQLQASIADAIAAADLPLSVLSALGAISETVITNDGVSALATLRVSIVDSIAASDSVSAPSASAYVVNVSVAWAAAEPARAWIANKPPRVWN